MSRIQLIPRGLGLGAALLLAAGCKSLDIQNPNAPDAKRALSDPGGVEAVAGGTYRSWFNTEMGYEGTLPLTVMANSYTASWNNANMRIYGTLPRQEWVNDPAAAARSSIEAYWYGYYSPLSSANDVMTAITKNNLVINSVGETKMVQTAAVLMQGLALAEIALIYDKGFIVDENADLANLQFADRKKMRDAAMAKFDAAIALASANTFTWPGGWFNGNAYTNVQVAQIANTFAARTLAYWPRSAAENAQVDWGRVKSYAQKGLSSGTPFDFIFTGDNCNNYCSNLLAWSNDPTTMRVATRVAHMLDPVTQADPWPDPQGNPQPNSPDKRLGDGSYGDANLAGNLNGVPQTGKGGTDFSWHSDAIFRPARGQWFQSNIAHIRYFYAGFSAPDGGGGGTAPVATATENNLLLAEALIRGGGDLGQAASLINLTRVGRGGLAPASAADGTAGLLTKLQYEQDIELMGLGIQPYYNRRRIDGLIAGTPAEMPIPAKELGVLGVSLYTFGGKYLRQSPTPP